MLPLNLAQVGLVSFGSLFFLPLQFWETRSQKCLCVRVLLPQGRSSLPPSLLFLSHGLVWSGLGLCCCSWPSSATVFHQNTKPQWSIQAQARSSAAPPSHPTLSWLCLLSPFLTRCTFNGPVKKDLGHFYGWIWRIKQAEGNWFLNTVCRFSGEMMFLFLACCCQSFCNIYI